MKKKKFIYFFIIILLIIAIVFFLNNKSNGKEEDIKAKAISEIEYLEMNIVDLLNSIQNIDLDKKQIEEGDVDWDSLKKDIQNIYTSIPTITLDLYSVGIEQNEILNFNKDLDSVMSSINLKEKAKTAENLAKLYSYLPKYINKVSDDIKYINTIEAKSNLFTAYSLLESEKWEEMSSYTKLALEDFSVVLGNSVDDKNIYVINKCYIELNELLNSIDEKDKETFLIKYLNLVEDLENL